MIVFDSSALIAILEYESDAAIYAAAIHNADRLLISAFNVHETGLILYARRRETALKKMWGFLQDENDFEIVAFDEAAAADAIKAFSRYGKGIHPQGRLNLADCAAYALAKSLDAPLLFKGADFAATDLRSALP